MEKLNLAMSGGFIAAAALAAVSVFTWFLVRIRVRQLRLPILRVLALPPHDLPKLKKELPPWIPFLCFCLAALSLVFLTLKPTSPKHIDSPLEGRHILAVVDLSPSTTSVVSLTRYREILSSFLDSVGERTRVSFALTDRKSLLQSDSHENLKESISKIEFHRFGTRLGQTIKNALAEKDSFTDLIIFSDEDSFSWSDFNWKFLASKLNITRVKLADALPGTNLFIKSVRFQSSPDSKIMELLVEIGASDGNTQNKAVISAKIAEEELSRQEFTFSGREASLVLSWPYSKLRNTSADWVTIQIDTKDSLAADNTFLVNKTGVLGEVLLVADPGGELPLEDPAHSLIDVFDILGLHVNRRDAAASKSDELSEALVVNWIGSHGRDTCSVSRTDKQSRYWVIPETSNDFLGVCRCVTKIASGARFALNSLGSTVASRGSDISPDPLQKFPIKCSDLTSRESWATALSANGFSQLGGDMSEAGQALAFRGDVASADVVIFQLPFSPLSGIPHGKWPTLVKSILKLQNLGEGAGVWPRYESIYAATEENSLSSSNVPAGESLLEQVQADIFPPSWQFSSGLSPTEMQDPDEKDPLPWIKRGWEFLLFLVVIEMIYFLYQTVKKDKRPSKLLLLIFITFGNVMLSSDLARAQGIVMSVLGTHPGSIKNFSKQLSDRTSISVDEHVQVWPSLSKKTLREPWLFVTDLSKIQSDSTAMNRDLEAWIRRGGILIIQGDYPTYQLEQLTSEGFRSTVKRGEWRPIAPDHEMMRSFYLIDSLPSCGGATWSEFRYDDRTAILVIPFGLTANLSGLDNTNVRTTPTPIGDATSKTKISNDVISSKGTNSATQAKSSPCELTKDEERLTRILVNIFMVSLATDYKKDQIHLPEILKRLR